MQPQTPQGQPTPVLPALDPFSMREPDVRYFVTEIARRDPVKAWEVWAQFKMKERLDDLLVVLGVVGILSLGTLLAVITILGRV